MTKNHNYYLDLAYQLAEKNLGKTGLNPSVGAIVVKDDSVISSGITSYRGRPHAEFNALSKIKNCGGASLYTSLEPCVHYGKTPPCTRIILKKKIKKVYFGSYDPDTRSYRKAKSFLSKKAIDVKKIKSNNYKNFYKSYFLNKKLNIPFVSAKIALSNDFLSINYKKKWITNENSRKIVHFLRSRYDCILSTSKTINSDNSLLNCRIDGLDQSKPDLFIIDINLKLKRNLLLNKIINKRKTYIVTNKSNLKRANTYKKKGYKFVFINTLKDKKDFISLYKRIYKLGYSRVLLETGLIFLRTVIKNKLINNLYLFKSNKNLTKIGKNNISPNFLKKIKFKPISVNLNGDKFFIKEF